MDDFLASNRDVPRPVRAAIVNRALSPVSCPDNSGGVFMRHGLPLDDFDSYTCIHVADGG